MGGQRATQSSAPLVSCNTCKFFDNNKCTWFRYFKDEEPKAIPDKIIDQGCKQFCDHPLILKAIRIFK